MFYLVTVGYLAFNMVKSKIDKREKAALISRVLNDVKVDIQKLREMALSPCGYISDELRRKVWPRLLGLQVDTKAMVYEKEKLKSHRDYEQVVLDVNRSIRRFPPAMKEEHRAKLQHQLTTLIMRVLVNNSQLHYYQGFHDICVTFLLILGKDLSFVVVDAITKSHLRDFMDVDMEKTRSMLNYLYPILKRADPELHAHMLKSDVGTIFCLSWLITWYGHVLDDTKHTVRLYDFFLASHPLMPIYLASAIVLYRREEVLQTPPEMCFIHSLLSQVPENLPYEHLISEAGELFDAYPPSELASEASFEYAQSKTMKNFAKFERGIGIKSEDKLCKVEQHSKMAETDSSQVQSLLLKVSMWTLTAVGAAVIAMQYAVS